MVSPLFNHLLIPYLIGVFLAINMGGSGTSPSFSAAFGANILRKSIIPGFFGIMVFTGALLAGKTTATTVGRDLLPADMMSFALVSIILFSVAISLLFANLAGIPQSTSQATIMAVTGPACYFSVLNEHKLFLEIIPAWFIIFKDTVIVSYIDPTTFGILVAQACRKVVGPELLLADLYGKIRVALGCIIRSCRFCNWGNCAIQHPFVEFLITKADAVMVDLFANPQIGRYDGDIILPSDLFWHIAYSISHDGYLFHYLALPLGTHTADDT